jgi:hypothetical protein
MEEVTHQRISSILRRVGDYHRITQNHPDIIIDLSLVDRAFSARVQIFH